MARHKEHEKEPNHERWLLTYSDLITLLMIFFIIMYSMSKTDQQKAEVVAQQLVNSLGSKGSDKNPMTTTTPTGALMKKELSFGELKQELNKIKIIVDSKYKGSISIQETKEGLTISLSNLLFFEPGTAELTAPLKEALDMIGKLIIENTSSEIEIRGFTDDRPLTKTSVYKTNWDLSIARASSVAFFYTGELKDRRSLQLKSQINNEFFDINFYYDPKRFYPVGKSDMDILKDIEIKNIEKLAEAEKYKSALSTGQITKQSYQNIINDLNARYDSDISLLRDRSRRIDILILRDRIR